MAVDLLNALRSLANNWTMKARDYARQSKEATEGEQASYYRGFAEGYYKAATELAAVIKDAPKPAPPTVAAPPRPETQGLRRSVASTQRSVPKVPEAPPASDASAAKYVSVSVGEAISILVFAGCQPRDVTPNADNSLRATFSSWGSMMLHEQVARVQQADPRIIILDSGKMESHDYFIEFAFKDN